jgi:hypothetical protein
MLLALRFLLPFFEVFLLHLRKVFHVSLLKAKIGVQGDLSGERSDEGEGIDSIGVPALFVRFLEDLQGIIGAQKAQSQGPSVKIGSSADGVQEKSGVMVEHALGWTTPFRVRTSSARGRPPEEEVQSGFQAVPLVFKDIADQSEVILVKNPEKQKDIVIDDGGVYSFPGRDGKFGGKLPNHDLELGIGVQALGQVPHIAFPVQVSEIVLDFLFHALAIRFFIRGLEFLGVGDDDRAFGHRDLLRWRLLFRWRSLFNGRFFGFFPPLLYPPKISGQNPSHDKDKDADPQPDTSFIFSLHVLSFAGLTIAEDAPTFPILMMAAQRHPRGA